MADLIQRSIIDALNTLLFKELGQTRDGPSPERIPAGYSEVQYALLFDSLSDLSFERFKDCPCDDNIIICLDLRKRILMWKGSMGDPL